VRIVVVGGGAAGFMAAVTCAESNRQANITILERGSDVLEKVRISGGGRCNVTHAEFIPKELVKHYPRGNRELLGPFSRFACGDTMHWFESRGVPLKIEGDGRVFPVSNRSADIVDCLTSAAHAAGVNVQTGQKLVGLEPAGTGWLVRTAFAEYRADKVLLATGSSSAVWQLIADLGHQVVPPVPSLFTFRISDPLLTDLAGVALPAATLRLPGFKTEITDNFLITHRGVSGFATLKLSARCARELHACGYKTPLHICFLPGQNAEALVADWVTYRQTMSAKTVSQSKVVDIPARLWQRLVALAGIDVRCTWADVSNKQLRALAGRCVRSEVDVVGRDANKEEFVAAGGVALHEIDFKRFESKLLPNLFFAGEVLDIDALTGGFNFQAAWTGGYLAGLAMAENAAY